MQDGSVRTVSAAEAVAGITSGDNVFIGSGAAEPDSLVAAMTARAPELRGVKIFHIYTLGAAGYCAPGLEESFRHIAFFVGANVRQAVADGRPTSSRSTPPDPSQFQQRYPGLGAGAVEPARQARLLQRGGVGRGRGHRHPLGQARRREINPQMPRRAPPVVRHRRQGGRRAAARGGPSTSRR
jgi:hypothetical protein